MAVRQQPRSLLPSSLQLAAAVSPYSLPQATNIVSERQPPPVFSSLHPSLLTNSLTTQTPSSDIGLAKKKSIIASNASSVNLSSAHSPLAMRVGSTSNVKPVPNLSIQEGLSNSFTQSSVLPSPTQSFPSTPPQRHLHILQQSHHSEPFYHTPPVHSYPQQNKKHGPVSDLWRVTSNYHAQLNQNNYNTMVGGSMQPSWEINDHVGEGFESWSPENSPTRNHGYNPGRNFLASRMNPGKNHRHEWPRQQSSPGYWDPGRQGSRNSHDRRR